MVINNSSLQPDNHQQGYQPPQYPPPNNQQSYYKQPGHQPSQYPPPLYAPPQYDPALMAAVKKNSRRALITAIIITILAILLLLGVAWLLNQLGDPPPGYFDRPPDVGLY